MQKRDRDTTNLWPDSLNVTVNDSVCANLCVSDNTKMSHWTPDRCCKTVSYKDTCTYGSGAVLKGHVGYSLLCDGLKGLYVTGQSAQSGRSPVQ